MRKHRVIKVSFSDNVKLYLTKAIGGDCWSKFWRKRDKMQKLYDKGQEMIETQLNILKIVKNLRNLKILMRGSMMTEKVKQQIAHEEKNLINLDSDELSFSVQESSDDWRNEDEEVEMKDMNGTTDGEPFNVGINGMPVG